MNGMEAFYTAALANKGKKLPLKTADGKETEHWLMVRSRHSDEFRSARDISVQVIATELAEIGEGKDEASAKKRRTLQDRKRLEMQAALVKEWSFDTPCTRDNVIDFLENAPQIAEQVDAFAGNDRLFFAADSSPPGPKTKSD